MTNANALYPIYLRIDTPHGTADFTGHEPPPNTLKATRVKNAGRHVAVTGRGILSLPMNAEGWELRLSIPEDIGVSLERALPLQRCQPGDMVTIAENLTRRDTLRVWQNAVVVDADSGSWFVGNPQQGDYFTIAMNFFLIGGESVI